MKITYYGQSAFLLDTGEHRLLLDPFLSGNPLCPVDPASVECDYILLTHGHGDHVGDTVDIAKRTGATLIANFEIVTWMDSLGIEKAHPLHIGGKASFEFGTAKMTTALHGSTFFKEDGSLVPLGNPGGFLLTVGGKQVYHAGDTALTYDMKLLAEFARVDLAMLPIGDNFTMGIDDACVAAQWCGAKKVIPMHYNTFPYIECDPQAFVKKCPVPVEVLDPGQETTL